VKGSEEVAAHFAANLRRARKRTGLTQEEVGFRASLHRTEVGMLERGVRVPKIDTLVKLCAAVGVRLECPLLDGISWEVGRTAVHTLGEFAIASRAERHATAMELAAKARARQTKVVDAAALVREGREELEERGARREARRKGD
jgi:transcriptional regulator with XRE-family HTH domain